MDFVKVNKTCIINVNVSMTNINACNDCLKFSCILTAVLSKILFRHLKIL